MSEEKKENQIPEEKPKNKMKLPLIIGLVVIVAVAGVFGFNYQKKAKAYEEAVSLSKAGDFVNAAEAFKNLGSFKDSEDYYKSCNYAEAQILMGSEKYEEAIALFEELGDYEDSKDNISLCQSALAYNEAMTLYENKEYEEAKKAFEALGDYNDSAVLAENCDLTIKAQALDGTKWFYSEGSNDINILTFTKDGVTLLKRSFGDNGFNQDETLECDYVATKDAILLKDKNTDAEISLAYKLDGDKITLDEKTYATEKMIDKKIQGYWVAEKKEYTTSFYGGAYYSKRRFDMKLKDGNVEKKDANTAAPNTGYTYFYFGPDKGTYAIEDGNLRFTINGNKGGVDTFFSYSNGKVTLYHYSIPFTKSDRKSLPDNSFYDSYF